MKFKLSLSQIRLTIFIMALVLLSGSVGFWLGEGGWNKNRRWTPAGSLIRNEPVDKKDLDLELFWSVWDRLFSSYFDKKKLLPKEMIYGAIKGMVASLGDPYTVFLRPEENKQAKEDLNGAFGGIGIELGFDQQNRMAVIAPLEGTPAKQAGVKAGDLILKIEEKETAEMSLPEAVQLIRGPEGTSVKLTLLHENDNSPFEAEIVRGTIIVPSVELEIIDDRCRLAARPCAIAHIKLLRFGDRTNNEWEEVVGQVISEPSLLGVILDLRNNPGGYLEGSVFIASEFLSNGVVVRQEMADGSKSDFEVNRPGKLLSPPLVVLVNKGSASASEIVAGALREHKRARIIGETTFGKGTIQEAQEVGEGAGLHVTTARWLLSSGESINQKGIEPDVIIGDDPETNELDEQVDRAVKALEQAEK